MIPSTIQQQIRIDGIDTERPYRNLLILRRENLLLTNHRFHLFVWLHQAFVLFYPPWGGGLLQRCTCQVLFYLSSWCGHRIQLLSISQVFLVVQVPEEPEQPVKPSKSRADTANLIALSGGYGRVSGRCGRFQPFLFKSTFIFGIMLSVYLPMIPLIHWFGAIISWLSKVVEGVVSASLWAFAHLDTDGEGMGRKAEHGYTFMLNLLLTPLLMVLGLVLSIVMMQVVGSLFASIFPLAVADIQGTSSTGIFSAFGFIIIFCTTSVTLVSTCCELIHSVPDRALSWIGAGGSDGAGKNMGGHFAAGTGGVAGMMHGSQIGSEAGKYKASEREKDIKAGNNGIKASATPPPPPKT